MRFILAELATVEGQLYVRQWLTLFLFLMRAPYTASLLSFSLPCWKLHDSYG